MSGINKPIVECKAQLEPHKESAQFTTLTQQLNRVLGQKDHELKQRKKKKYLRDTNDYKQDQVFKWQLQLKDSNLTSTNSTPERDVCITSPQRDQEPSTPIRPSRLEPRGEHQAPRTPKPWWQN